MTSDTKHDTLHLESALELVGLLEEAPENERRARGRVGRGARVGRERRRHEQIVAERQRHAPHHRAAVHEVRSARRLHRLSALEPAARRRQLDARLEL